MRIYYIVRKCVHSSFALNSRPNFELAFLRLWLPPSSSSSSVTSRINGPPEAERAFDLKRGQNSSTKFDSHLLN